MNKVGVMIGPDIRVNEDGELEAVPDNHNNTNNKFSNEEMQDPTNQFEFTLYILNQYYVLLTRGIDGIRLVELDFDEAIGTFTYLDNHYVRPHGFRKGSVKINQTFATELLLENHEGVTKGKIKWNQAFATEEVLNGI